MEKELEKKLFEKYPTIFAGRSKSLLESLMSFGLECGSGWHDLIDELSGQIINHEENQARHLEWKIKKGEVTEEDRMYPVEAVQVKEKFGGLRFYISGGDEYVRGLIDMAEGMSYQICEQCGQKGKPNRGGWITTLCDPCRVDYDKRIGYSSFTFGKDET